MIRMYRATLPYSTLTPGCCLNSIPNPNPKEPIEAHLTKNVLVQHFGALRYKQFDPISDFISDFGLASQGLGQKCSLPGLIPVVINGS